MANFNIVVKFLFYVVVVLGAGLVVERFTRIKHWKMGPSLALRDVVYNSSSHLDFEDLKTVIRKNYLKCLTNPSKPFCLMSANKKLEIFQGNQSPSAEEVKSTLKNMTAGLHVHTSRMRSLLTVFTKLMEDHNVKVMLIEPSILFCLLSDEKKNGMLLKGFNPSRHLGSRNIVTLGTFSEHSAKLDEANLTEEALSAGFKIQKYRRFIGKKIDQSLESVHYIFTLQDIAVHVVVFYSFDSYWWHAGLDAETDVQENILFLEDGIFERFLPLLLNLDDISMNGMIIPHDIRYFMLQIESSKYVKCNGNPLNASSSLGVLQHPSLTVEELKNRAEVALKELKAVLAPHLVLFWLWSDTFLGWFTQCDIFYYTTTLELAVWNKSIEGLDLATIIADSDNLEVSNSTELTRAFGYRIICHGLEINLSILYEDEDSLRIKDADELKKFNFIHPGFSLCSTSLYRLKIQVPCYPLEVLHVRRQDV